MKEHARVVMDKKRLKIALAVLNAVTSTFPETNEFIDSTLKEECEKENMNADKVIEVYNRYFWHTFLLVTFK